MTTIDYAIQDLKYTIGPDWQPCFDSLDELDDWYLGLEAPETAQIASPVTVKLIDYSRAMGTLPSANSSAAGRLATSATVRLVRRTTQPL